MTKKKSGLAGLRETLKIDKLMDKISEVVDGKSSMSDIDTDDVIANRIKEIHELVDKTRKVHQEQANAFGELAGLLKKLLADIVTLREEASELDAGANSSTTASTTEEPSAATTEETVSSTAEPAAAESAEPETKAEPEPEPEAAESTDEPAKKQE